MSAFDRLASKLATQKGVSDPRALAAAIGARKFSRPVMQQAAAKGVSAQSIANKRQ